MKKIVFITLIMMNLNAMAQNTMSPELLLKLGRVTTLGLSKDGKNIAKNNNAQNNKGESALTKAIQNLMLMNIANVAKYTFYFFNAILGYITWKDDKKKGSLTTS